MLSKEHFDCNYSEVANGHWGPAGHVFCCVLCKESLCAVMAVRPIRPQSAKCSDDLRSYRATIEKNVCLGFQSFQFLSRSRKSRPERNALRPSSKSKFLWCAWCASEPLEDAALLLCPAKFSRAEEIASCCWRVNYGIFIPARLHQEKDFKMDLRWQGTQTLLVQVHLFRASNISALNNLI